MRMLRDWGCPGLGRQLTDQIPGVGLDRCAGGRPGTCMEVMSPFMQDSGFPSPWDLLHCSQAWEHAGSSDVFLL